MNQQLAALGIGEYRSVSARDKVSPDFESKSSNILGECKKHGLEGIIKFVSYPERLQQEAYEKANVSGWMLELRKQKIENDLDSACQAIAGATASEYHARNFAKALGKLFYYSQELGYKVSERLSHAGVDLSASSLLESYKAYLRNRIIDNVVLANFDNVESLLEKTGFQPEEIISAIETSDFHGLSKWDKRSVLRRFRRAFKDYLHENKPIDENTIWTELAIEVQAYALGREGLGEEALNGMHGLWNAASASKYIRPMLKHFAYTTDEADLFLDIATTIATRYKANISEIWGASKEDYTALQKKLIHELQDKRITLAELIQTALYDAEFGRYTRPETLVGNGLGEFTTMPHQHDDFWHIIANNLFTMWNQLGKPKIFQVTEMGAGEGKMAYDILQYINMRSLEYGGWKIEDNSWKSFNSSLHYVIVELNKALADRQKAKLREFKGFKANVVQVVQGSALQLPFGRESVTGCFLSNELPDAFPVHKVVMREGELRECYVTAKNSMLVEEESGLSTDELKKYFEDIKIKLREGQTAYVNLLAPQWMKNVAGCLKQGYVLTFDYGMKGDKLYDLSNGFPQLRAYGSVLDEEERNFRLTYTGATTRLSLLSYLQNPLSLAGRKDLTADVDFETLARIAALNGLQEVAFMTQNEYLKQVCDQTSYTPPKNVIFQERKLYKAQLLKK